MRSHLRASRRFAASRPTLAWIALAGLVAGTLDILYATGFWALKGVPPERILQSVAAGVLGRASFSGGGATAMLGLALHYVIATAMAAAYFLVAPRRPVLLQRSWWCGALYGLLLYAVMQYVVLPLSAAPGGGTPDPVWVACSVAAHVLLVGMPIARLARRALVGAGARSNPYPATDAG